MVAAKSATNIIDSAVVSFIFIIVTSMSDAHAVVLGGELVVSAVGLESALHHHTFVPTELLAPVANQTELARVWKV